MMHTPNITTSSNLSMVSYHLSMVIVGGSRRGLNWQLLETRRDGDTDPFKQFVWDIRYIDSLIVRFRDSNTNGTLDDTLYYTNDANFNVTALMDDEGDILERYEYTPYGERFVLNDDFTTHANPTSGGYDNHRGHQGLAHDPLTGLIDNRNRIYHPTLGRFIQRDPLGYPDGMNTYAGYHIMWDGMDPMGLAFVAFDGTGNDTNQTDMGHSTLTNVRKLFDASNDPNAIYKAGVGSASRPENQTRGGLTGYGGDAVLNEAWEELAEKIKNSEDETIDLIGFSRGAALAMTFANMIHERNGKTPGRGENWTPLCRPVTIRFVGLFDMVGSFGIPGNQVNIGKNLTLPPGVGKAVHALAFDEYRPSFPVTRVKGAHEVWFAGAHSNIGGGYMLGGGLSDITLLWMYHHAVAAGVNLNKPFATPTPFGTIRHPADESVAMFMDVMLGGFAYRKVQAKDLIHITMEMRGHRFDKYAKELRRRRPSTTNISHDPWK